MAKRGRPTRAVASKKALKNVDVDAIDPLKVLREIAADTSAPALARLQAARALLAHGGGKKADEADDRNEQQQLDRVSERALRLLQGGRK